MHHPTDRITHALVTPVVEHWLEQEIALVISSMCLEVNEKALHLPTGPLKTCSWVGSTVMRTQYPLVNDLATVPSGRYFLA